MQRTAWLLILIIWGVFLNAACGSPVGNPKEAQEYSRAPASAEMCATEKANLDMFPWPEPTLVGQLNPSLFTESSAATVQDIGDEIIASLERAGYPDYGYYGVGCNGFALVTHMERTDDDAAPLIDPDRWEFPQGGEEIGLVDFISRLFYAPIGKYRMITFVVTDTPLPDFGAPVEPAELQAILNAGDVNLTNEDDGSRPYDELEFADGYKIYALIYQFQKDSVDNSVSPYKSDGISVAGHLEKAGLFE